MSSIARQIHLSWIWKSFRKTLGGDILLAILLLMMALVQREYAAFEGFHVEYRREIGLAEETGEHASDSEITARSNVVSGDKNGKSDEEYDATTDNDIKQKNRLKFVYHVTPLDRFQELQYTVSSRDGDILLEVALFPILAIIFIVLSIVIAFQMIGFFISYLPDARKIRKKLKPINDFALKADQLRRLNFSEDKYQQIEAAISNFQPEESELLSFGDSELQGIEAAMNNLLIHMRESYQQQARFVNDASHELRTPIAVIQGYANMLSRWGREDEKVLDESITAIQHESDHMKYLVEQLLFLARGDSGRTTLKKEEFSLNEMVQEIYEESFMIDEAHPYRFKKPDQEIRLNADMALIKQATRILIDNAAKYTKPGDEIYLSYGTLNDSKDKGRVYIQIQDTGIGMAESDVAHMFERFYRSDEARGYQGTGLGLAIAKWIVDKHQGHFEILSRTELGTRIRIVL